MSDVSGSELRALMARVPSVEKVMASAEFTALLAEYGRTQVLTAVREALDTWHAKAEGKAAIDYGFHMIATDVPPAQLQEMADISRTRRPLR